MIRSLYNGASGVFAQLQNLDVTAHNIANLETTGYKKESIHFKELLQQRMGSQGLPVLEKENPPVIVGTGTAVSSTGSRFTQGVNTPTGRELDLAIEGDGFFPVTGPDGSVFYTRDGSFKVDNQGQIVNAQGFLLVDEQIPEGRQKIWVNELGQIAYQDNAGETHELSQIELVFFTRPQELQKVGDNFYVETETSGPPEYVLLEENQANAIRQGYLEQANVDLAEEMENLIESQRILQLNTRSITSADQMWSIANNLQK